MEILFKKISKKEYGIIFNNFEKSIFRFEQLDFYNVESEKKYFQEFLEGEKKPSLNFLKEWQNFLLEKTREGKRIQRVRKFSNPRSDYEKFEKEWGYKNNLNFGEEINFLKEKIDINFSNSIPLISDFWLIDNKKCFLLDYDSGGNFLGVREVPESFIDVYIKFSYFLLNNSEKYEG